MTTALRDALLAIRDQYGELTPEIVVQAATLKSHPLHDRFEWDNKKAGHLYRRDQAHELIQSVRVTYRDAKDDEHDVRAFVAVPREDSPRPTYEPIEEVALDDFKRKLVLQAAEREWRNLRSRYGHLSEFIDMVARDTQAAAS